MNVKKLAILIFVYTICSFIRPDAVLANNASYTAQNSEILEAKENNPIQNCYSIEDFQIKKQNNSYSIYFCYETEKIALECDFFKLQDAALSDGKVIGRVTGANRNIFYIAFSKSLNLLDRLDQELSEDEVLFSIVFQSEQDGEIVNANVVFQRSTYPIINRLFTNSLCIDYENELYGELLHSQLWMKTCIPENQMVANEFLPDEVSPEAGSYENHDHTIVLTFLNKTYLKTPKHAYGMKYNLDGEPIGLYIRDTFQFDDSYITLLALFDITAAISGSGNDRNVTFQVQHTYDYFVEISADGDMKVTEADANSTYLATKNPSLGIMLTGTATDGYFSACIVDAHSTGSNPSVMQSLGNRAIHLFEKIYPIISKISSLFDFLGSAAKVSSDADYDAARKQFGMFGTMDGNDTNHPKIISTMYENQMYKQYSLFRMFVTIERGKEPSTDPIEFQFQITIIGPQYQQNPIIKFKKTL